MYQQYTPTRATNTMPRSIDTRWIEVCTLCSVPSISIPARSSTPQVRPHPMKLDPLFFLIASASALACMSAQADVFPAETLQKIDKKEAGGGQGTLSGAYAFTRDKATKDQAIKEISWL